MKKEIRVTGKTRIRTEIDSVKKIRGGVSIICKDGTCITIPQSKHLLLDVLEVLEGETK